MTRRKLIANNGVAVKAEFNVGMVEGGRGVVPSTDDGDLVNSGYLLALQTSWFVLELFPIVYVVVGFAGVDDGAHMGQAVDVDAVTVGVGGGGREGGGGGGGFGVGGGGGLGGDVGWEGDFPQALGVVFLGGGCFFLGGVFCVFGGFCVFGEECWKYTGEVDAGRK